MACAATTKQSVGSGEENLVRMALAAAWVAFSLLLALSSEVCRRQPQSSRKTLTDRH